jgi:hypothetical protein
MLVAVAAAATLSVFVILYRLLQQAQSEDRSRYNPNEGGGFGEGGA